MSNFVGHKSVITSNSGCYEGVNLATYTIYINKQAWMTFNKSVFTETGDSLDLAHVL